MYECQKILESTEIFVGGVKVHVEGVKIHDVGVKIHVVGVKNVISVKFLEGANFLES